MCAAHRFLPAPARRWSDVHSVAGFAYAIGMQLRLARLCLDCEEIHDRQQCPICASESFAYLSRWVPSPERPIAARRSPAQAEAAAKSKNVSGSGKKALGWGVVGLGVVGLAQWLARGQKVIEDAALRNPGDLK